MFFKMIIKDSVKELLNMITGKKTHMATETSLRVIDLLQIAHYDKIGTYRQQYWRAWLAKKSTSKFKMESK